MTSAIFLSPTESIHGSPQPAKRGTSVPSESENVLPASNSTGSKMGRQRQTPAVEWHSSFRVGSSGLGDESFASRRGISHRRFANSAYRKPLATAILPDDQSTDDHVANVDALDLGCHQQWPRRLGEPTNAPWTRLPQSTGHTVDSCLPSSLASPSPMASTDRTRCQEDGDSDDEAAHGECDWRSLLANQITC